VRSLTFHEDSLTASYSVVGDHPADPEELNPDYIHPNDAGYRKIAASINLNGL
jgi:lysophospholipase L1-like esterase